MALQEKEKSIVVSLVSDVVVFGTYAAYVIFGFPEQNFQSSDIYVFVGQSFFILLGAFTIVSILRCIMRFTIKKKISNGVSDERDKIIDLKAIQNAFFTFFIGFIISMGILAFEMLEPYTVFFLIITFMFVGSIVGEVTKFIIYRRGY